MIPIIVTPIPHEPTRFYASSRSRPDMMHLVDLAFDDDGVRKPHCGCEDGHIRGKWCQHIQAVIEYLCAVDAAQRIKDGLEEPERNEDDPRLENR